MSTPLHQLSKEEVKAITTKQIVALTNKEALKAFTDSHEHLVLLSELKSRALELLGKSTHNTYQ